MGQLITKNDWLKRLQEKLQPVQKDNLHKSADITNEVLSAIQPLRNNKAEGSYYKTIIDNKMNRGGC